MMHGQARLALVVHIYFNGSLSMTWPNHLLIFKFFSCKVNTVGLGFNSLANTIMVMLSLSVYLTTLFLGRLSPFSD